MNFKKAFVIFSVILLFFLLIFGLCFYVKYNHLKNQNERENSILKKYQLEVQMKKDSLYLLDTRIDYLEQALKVKSTQDSILTIKNTQIDKQYKKNNADILGLDTDDQIELFTRQLNSSPGLSPKN
jgi:hypothetical protein